MFVHLYACLCMFVHLYIYVCAQRQSAFSRNAQFNHTRILSP